MADRFPSIEDIGAGDGEVKADGAPAGSFLDRERAALGEDADLFATTDDHRATNTTVEDGDDDLLGGDDTGPVTHGQSAGDDLDGFESSFPAISTQNENVGPGGAVTSTTNGYTNYTPQATDEESPAIQAWREKRDADLQRRDEASTRKKEETVSKAREDIDAYYETYNRKLDRQKEQVAKEAEEFLSKREDTTSGGTSWERIAKLVDLSGKGQLGGGEGSTKKKMREMLMSLKADKDAPGAGGV